MSNKKKSKVNKQFINDNIEFVRTRISEGDNITKAVSHLCHLTQYPYDDTLRRSFAKRLQHEGVTQNAVIKVVPIEHTDEFKEAQNREVRKSKYYLLTWAQAETPVHQQFWQNMLAYAEHIGAEIIVSAGRYKNPNSIEKSREIESKEKNKTIWAPEVRDYLYASRIDLNSMLTVICDVKIQPTNMYPINGVNGFTGIKTSVVPHPKVQLKSLPVLKDYPQKLVLSTGACTVENYTDTRIGKKGEFEHELGFVICEIVDEKQFFIRQVQADDSGRFYDLNYCVNYGYVNNSFKSKEDFMYPFIVWGDLHLTQEDPVAVDLATELTNKLRVENVILHDLFDGNSVNPHSEKDPFRMLEKEESGEDDLEWEIECLKNWLRAYSETLDYSKLHIIASNHNDFLDRFLKNVDWRKTRNKKLYLELSYIKSQGLAEKGMVNYIIDEEFKDNKYLKTYAYGESLKMQGDWECGLHYDKGANGSRGSIGQFKDLSTKTIGGHGHSAQRYGGAIMTPTLTKLQLDYNSGSLSSWVQGVTLGYPNGKASQIIFINGAFTTLWDKI